MYLSTSEDIRLQHRLVALFKYLSIPAVALLLTMERCRSSNEILMYTNTRTYLNRYFLLFFNLESVKYVLPLLFKN